MRNTSQQLAVRRALRVAATCAAVAASIPLGATGRGEFFKFVQKERYSLDKIYASPTKWGAAPSSVTWTPDGSRIAWLALRHGSFADPMKRTARYFEDRWGIGREAGRAQPTSQDGGRPDRPGSQP